MHLQCTHICFKPTHNTPSRGDAGRSVPITRDAGNGQAMFPLSLLQAEAPLAGVKIAENTSTSPSTCPPPHAFCLEPFRRQRRNDLHTITKITIWKMKCELAGERGPDHPAQAAGSAASTASIAAAILHHDPATAVRVASPFCLDNLWVPWELATLGVIVCACLGAVLGISTRRNSGDRNNNARVKGGTNVHEGVTAAPHARGVGNAVVPSASSTSKDHLSWDCTRGHSKRRGQERKRRSTIVKRHSGRVTDPHVHQD